jgi:dTDP-4-dehydrorhamnose reductase
MGNIVILGGSGMLGSMLVDVLSRAQNHKIVATVRDPDLANRFAARAPEVDWKPLNVDPFDPRLLGEAIAGADWVINAIGMTKPYTHDDNPMEIERAIKINGLLTYQLGHLAGQQGARVIQIATDCVFDGVKGNFVESDPHNALDVYGKTKSLGEALLPNVYCLRCSIIGPEPKTYAFLLEWFRRQPKDAHVNGYTNHQWNGVTTLHFGKICLGIITQNMALSHIQHIIPTGAITKADLLTSFAQAYHREDISIQPVAAKYVVDRILATGYPALNQQLWMAAGYPVPPTVPQMVALTEYST